jgi:hypothetical protein
LLRMLGFSAAPSTIYSFGGKSAARRPVLVGQPLTLTLRSKPAS